MNSYNIKDLAGLVTCLPFHMHRNLFTTYIDFKVVVVHRQETVIKCCRIGSVTCHTRAVSLSVPVLIECDISNVTLP